MKIKDYKQISIHDIDWGYYDNRDGKKWAGKTIERAGFVNRGERDEQMLLITFTDKTFICVTYDYEDNESNRLVLQDNYIYEYPKETLAQYHSYINNTGNIEFDLWVRMLIDFGFYELTEEEAKEIREEKERLEREREYNEYLRLKAKYENTN